MLRTPPKRASSGGGSPSRTPDSGDKRPPFVVGTSLTVRKTPPKPSKPAGEKTSSKSSELVLTTSPLQDHGNALSRLRQPNSLFTSRLQHPNHGLSLLWRSQIDRLKEQADHDSRELQTLRNLLEESRHDIDLRSLDGVHNDSGPYSIRSNETLQLAAREIISLRYVPREELQAVEAALEATRAEAARLQLYIDDVLPHLELIASQGSWQAWLGRSVGPSYSDVTELEDDGDEEGGRSLSPRADGLSEKEGALVYEHSTVRRDSASRGSPSSSVISRLILDVLKKSADSSLAQYNKVEGSDLPEIERLQRRVASMVQKKQEDLDVTSRKLLGSAPSDSNAGIDELELHKMKRVKEIEELRRFGRLLDMVSITDPEGVTYGLVSLVKMLSCTFEPERFPREVDQLLQRLKLKETGTAPEEGGSFKPASNSRQLHVQLEKAASIPAPTPLASARKSLLGCSKGEDLSPVPAFASPKSQGSASLHDDPHLSPSPATTMSGSVRTTTSGSFCLPVCVCLCACAHLPFVCPYLHEQVYRNPLADDRMLAATTMIETVADPICHFPASTTASLTCARARVPPSPLRSSYFKLAAPCRALQAGKLRLRPPSFFS